MQSLKQLYSVQGVLVRVGALLCGIKMWSEGYTAAPGITEDVYQMISFSVDKLPGDEGWPLDSLLGLRKQGVCHFVLTFVGNESVATLETLGSHLYDVVAPVVVDGAPTLCITAVLEMYADKAWLDGMIQAIRPDTLFLKVVDRGPSTDHQYETRARREELMRIVGQFITDVRKNSMGTAEPPAKPLGRGLFPVTRTHLGLWGKFQGMDNLQQVVDKYSADIEVFHFGILELPNLRWRQVEYVNSHGKNIMYTVLPGACGAEGVQFLAGYAANYDQTPLAFLAKALIQLGVVPEMAPGLSEVDMDTSLLVNHKPPLSFLRFPSPPLSPLHTIPSPALSRRLLP